MTGAVLERAPPKEKTATGLKTKKWVNPIYATSGEHKEDVDGKLVPAKKAIVAPQAKKQLTMAERRQQAGKTADAKAAQPATIPEADETDPVSHPPLPPFLCDYVPYVINAFGWHSFMKCISLSMSESSDRLRQHLVLCKLAQKGPHLMYQSRRH